MLKQLIPKHLNAGKILYNYRDAAGNTNIGVNWGNLWSSIVKPIAHKINEHGNSEYDDSIEEFKKTNCGYGYGSLRSQEIRNKANKWYKKNFPKDPPKGHIFSKEYRAWANRALDAYVKDLYNGEAGKRWREGVKRNGTPAQTAARVSLAGTAIGVIPSPWTKVGGIILSVPDQIYDWAAAIDEPKPSNTAHVITNYGSTIAEAIPGKRDDIILKGLDFIGDADDAASSQGSNLFGWMDDLKY